MRMSHFGAQNSPFILNKIFLAQAIIITFLYLLTLFIVQNQKKFLQRIQSYKDAPFLGSERSICSQIFFFWKKLLISFSSNYWPISLCKILKKFLLQIQSYEDAPFLGSKWPICPNENLFRKPVNKPCSFHSCLSTCKKSKSDINLLMKY